MTGRRVGYILKMYPRFSETFILNELLELERQGVALRIFSLKRPDDGIGHADAALLEAPVTYVPSLEWRNFPCYAAAHLRAFAANPRGYAGALLHLLRRRRRTSIKHFLQGGLVAPLVRREGIRHVHSHFASGATSVALHVQRLAGTSYSFTAHAKDIYLSSVTEIDLSRKLRGAHFAVTISEFNCRHLSRLAPEARLVRIYNGVDPGRFTPNGVPRMQPPLVLAVGRLIEKKGFDDLIRACALLRADGVPFCCRIAGKGALDRDLRSLIGDLGLGALVELAGPIPRERLFELYSQASVLAAPCVIGADGNRDGLPTVLVEAMALGVPVVATDVTGIPELVEGGRTGLIVPQRDPAALAQAIRTLLADPSWSRLLARAARRHVEQQFDLRRNVAELRSLFEEAAAQ
jgi:colanic acid/amylovoran biosynthesis glycosyltransferase